MHLNVIRSLYLSISMPTKKFATLSKSVRPDHIQSSRSNQEKNIRIPVFSSLCHVQSWLHWTYLNGQIMYEGGYKIRNQAAVHFITFAVVEWIDVFTTQNYRDFILDSIRFCQNEKGLLVHHEQSSAFDCIGKDS